MVPLITLEVILLIKIIEILELLSINIPLTNLPLKYKCPMRRLLKNNFYRLNAPLVS